MSDSINIGILLDLLGAVQHYGERLAVQRQITVVLIVVVAAWFISNMLWLIARRGAASFTNRLIKGERSRILRYIVLILKNIMFPGLALIALTMAQQNFVGRHWHAGLLDRFLLLFWAILIYRFIIGFMYARLGHSTMRRYHYRFLAPLFYILVSAWLLNHLIPLTNLAGLQVWEGFTNPITLGALLIATLGFYFWFDGTGILQDIIRFIISPLASVDSGAVEAALIIGRYVLIALGIYAVFAILGFDSTTMAFLTGGLSVGIGFGLKEVIGNLISGLLLLIDQSLRPGDVIEVDGQMSTVENVGIRATTVRTTNNVEMVVPNQIFLTSSVTTYTKSDEPIRMLVDVEAADEHSPEMVRDALLKVADSHLLVVKRPKPTVFYINTGDTSRQYQLAVWFTQPLKSKPLHSELYYMLQEEFDAQGIKPSTPARDLNITHVPWRQEGEMLPLPVPA